MGGLDGEAGGAEGDGAFGESAEAGGEGCADGAASSEGVGEMGVAVAHTGGCALPAPAFTTEDFFCGVGGHGSGYLVAGAQQR